MPLPRQSEIGLSLRNLWMRVFPAYWTGVTMLEVFGTGRGPTWAMSEPLPPRLQARSSSWSRNSELPAEQLVMPVLAEVHIDKHFNTVRETSPQA